MSSTSIEGMFLPMIMMLQKNTDSFFGALTFPIMILYSILTNSNIRESIKLSWSEFKKWWYGGDDQKSTVIFKANPSQRCKSEYFDAVCWFIRNNINKSMTVFEEVSYRDFEINNPYRLSTLSFFKVSQGERFHICDDIYGRVSTSLREINDGEKKISSQFEEIYLTSTTKESKELMEFVEKIHKEYLAFIRSLKTTTQLLVECIWDSEKKDFVIKSYPWKSLATFETRMFEEKEMLIRQVDSFVNGRETFEKRGIPYHLGILLHGAPGCGKTSFIKALANKTKRCIIDVKLTDDVDLEKLTALILNERINSELYIPISNRLYLFEDIDAMGKMVEKRKTEETKIPLSSTIDSIPDSSSTASLEVDDPSSDKTSTGSTNTRSASSKLVDQSQMSQLIEIATSLGKSEKSEFDYSYFAKKKQNTMSTLLNILDGVQENPGRIIVMTTNHIEKLDPAIIRPGRIDINLEFKPASGKIISEMVSHYWKNSPDPADITPQDLMKKYHKLSAIDPIPHCKVTELCRMSTSIDDCIDRIFRHNDL